MAIDPKSLEINRELVLSTSHVQEATMDWLRESDGRITPDGYEDFDRPAGDSVEYGALVFCMYDDDETAAMPADLGPLVRLARDNDCKWLRLDCDGPVVDGLPAWEW